MNTEVVIYHNKELKFRVKLDDRDDAEILGTHSIFIEGTQTTIRQFCNSGQIRALRDACNIALTEFDLDQITRDQAVQIKGQLATIKEKPRCGCGRDLLTQTELKVATCHICMTDDGTLLGEEQKYVPGAMV